MPPLFVHPHRATAAAARNTLAQWLTMAYFRIHNLGTFITSPLTPLLEPAMRLTIDVMTVIILGLTFLFQSASMIVSMDNVVMEICHSIYRGIDYALSTILNRISVNTIVNERTRKEVTTAFGSFVLSILWTYGVYGLSSETWQRLFYLPAAVMLQLHLLTTFLASILSSYPTSNILRSCVGFLLLLFFFTFREISAYTPDKDRRVVLLLFRPTVDYVLQNVGEIFLKLLEPFFDQTISDASIDGTGMLSLELNRAGFWFALATSEALSPNRKHQRVFMLLICTHDLIAMCMPMRKLMKKVMYRRYISNNFPRISENELDTLREENCAVCLSPHSAETVRLPCRHTFHAACLNQIIENGQLRCPICRADIGIGATRNPGPPGVFPGPGSARDREYERTFQVRDVIRVRFVSPSRRISLRTNLLRNNHARTYNWLESWDADLQGRTGTDRTSFRVHNIEGLEALQTQMHTQVPLPAPESLQQDQQSSAQFSHTASHSAPSLSSAEETRGEALSEEPGFRLHLTASEMQEDLADASLDTLLALVEQMADMDQEDATAMELNEFAAERMEIELPGEGLREGRPQGEGLREGGPQGEVQAAEAQAETDATRVFGEEIQGEAPKEMEEEEKEKEGSLTGQKRLASDQSSDADTAQETPSEKEEERQEDSSLLAAMPPVHIQVPASASASVPVPVPVSAHAGNASEAPVQSVLRDALPTAINLKRQRIG